MSMVINQSKHGFHACDYATFRQLKEDHKLALRHYRDVKKYIRWANKEPHNRKTEQPECCYEATLASRFWAEGEWTKGRAAAKDEYARDLYFRVLKAYQHARKPYPTPEEAGTLNLSHVEELTKIRAFYENK